MRLVMLHVPCDCPRLPFCPSLPSFPPSVLPACLCSLQLGYPRSPHVRKGWLLQHVVLLLAFLSLMLILVEQVSE